MTWTVKRVRWTLVAAGLAVATLVLATLLARDRPLPVAIDGNHGAVRLGRGDETRILRAVEAANASATQDELVAEGRRLFRSTAMSKDGESCQTCHTEGSASAELGTIPHPRFDGDFVGPRDPPALWDIARTAPFFWNGDVPTIEAASIRPVLDHFAAFPDRGCPDGPDKAACLARAGGFAAAITAFMKQLKAPISAFDQGTMSAAALRGEELFQGKAGCVECHGGPQFTDNLIHDVGVPKTSSSDTDVGAGPPPALPACQVPAPPPGCAAAAPAGTAFINTPQLRDVKNTAPYFHNGVKKTLREVVKFYDADSLLAPMNLTAAEIDDLVAFLEAL